ncbi:hypothetical protein MNBD_ALPHA08-419 [hydrothermal vent metagenome]|uniref:DUF1674 domain-containing protein n=1 Tax=hydrothermal vent metagenome TaxID=652676 RepID=A0A3B0SBQ3_9ZZZZ
MQMIVMTNLKQKTLSAAAKRALAEAQARRDAAKKAPRELELHGRKGLEATRFGDWEKNGIVSDF